MKDIAKRDEGIVEKVVLKGDLSALTPEERVSYYNQLCTYLGLNAVTQPFKILRLQGKDVLYATKDATEQLRKKNGVSIDSLDGKHVEDVYVVTAKGHDASGRTDMATGAVTTGSSKGDTLANLLMKAETKAKRRLTLSICGLGVLDETDVETIPGAEPVRDVTPEEPTRREKLLARAKAAVDAGVLNPGEVGFYRQECRGALKDDALEKVVEEMEKSVAANAEGSDSMIDDEPVLPEPAQPTKDDVEAFAVDDDKQGMLNKIGSIQDGENVEAPKELF